MDRWHGSRIGFAYLLICLFLAGTVVPAGADPPHTGAVYPEPGTYRLYKIQKAPGARVLEDGHWWPRRLTSYTDGTITLLSFFYSSCRDPVGCPALWSAFETVRAELIDRPELHGKVRLIFISLDPGVDTPERLRVFAEARRDSYEIAPWNFLTTRSERHLKPILDGFGQSASRSLDENGYPLPEIGHQVKIYLIDRKSWVREIYSTAFFGEEVFFNDVETLLLEEQGGGIN